LIAGRPGSRAQLERVVDVQSEVHLYQGIRDAPVDSIDPGPHSVLVLPCLVRAHRTATAARFPGRTTFLGGWATTAGSSDAERKTCECVGERDERDVEGDFEVWTRRPVAAAGRA